MTGPAELSLRAYQETVLRVFFSREPSADDLVALGSPERFGVYRKMVRHRLDKVVRAALPRTLQEIGASVYVERAQYDARSGRLVLTPAAALDPLRAQTFELG